MNSPRPRPLEESLLQGIRAARDLGPATDALTETLAHIERNLRELAWGVEVSVPLDGFPDSALRFGKSGSNWALEVTRPGTPPIPLVNSSRRARVAAVDALPALIQALAEGTEEEAQRVLLAGARAAGHRSWLETHLGGVLAVGELSRGLGSPCRPPNSTSTISTERSSAPPTSPPGLSTSTGGGG